MQNVLALAPAIAATSGFGSAAGKGRAGMVDTRDVAAVAAGIATAPTPHAGQTYWLSGPEAISNYDVAAVLSELLGRTISYAELSFDENREAMVQGRRTGRHRRDERAGVQHDGRWRRGMGQ